jgi:hypothetical protein
MRRRSELAIWFLLLCLGGGLAAQEPAPESKGEPAPQQPPAASAPATMPKIVTPVRIRVSQGVAAGLLVKKVNPEYPEEARHEG